MDYVIWFLAAFILIGAFVWFMARHAERYKRRSGRRKGYEPPEGPSYFDNHVGSDGGSSD
ncbi:MAG TPA: hypothetical protein VEC11_05630 [Allosphingosinicella sp.]|nr:hypothetical protein [Allosphingosinicella sp.]